MTQEHSQAPCSVKNRASKPILHDDESSFFWGNPEEIIEVLQLWKRVGHKKFTDLLQAIADHREKSAAEILEEVGIGGKTPKVRDLLRKPAREAFNEYVRQGFADAPLNDTQRQVVFRRLYGYTHVEIGQELDMSAATSSSNMSRAKAIVRAMDIVTGIVREP